MPEMQVSAEMERVRRLSHRRKWRQAESLWLENGERSMIEIHIGQAPVAYIARVALDACQSDSKPRHTTHHRLPAFVRHTLIIVAC